MEFRRVLFRSHAQVVELLVEEVPSLLTRRKQNKTKQKNNVSSHVQTCATQCCASKNYPKDLDITYKLSCQHRNMFNNCQPDAPLAIFSKLYNCRKQRL